MRYQVNHIEMRKCHIIGDYMDAFSLKNKNRAINRNKSPSRFQGRLVSMTAVAGPSKLRSQGPLEMDFQAGGRSPQSFSRVPGCPASTPHW